jgi:hypothetical protein
MLVNKPYSPPSRRLRPPTPANRFPLATLRKSALLGEQRRVLPEGVVEKAVGGERKDKKRLDKHYGLVLQ